MFLGVSQSEAGLLILLSKLGIDISAAMKHGGMFIHRDGYLYIWRAGIDKCWERVMAPTELEPR